MHPIRKQILKLLLFSQTQRFSQLKPKEITGSLFTFHLDELIKEGYILKNPNGDYSLSEEGKLLANKYDFDSKQPNMQAKLSVIVCPFREDSSEVLIYKRLKNPFYGCQGFMTGKVQYGESFLEAAKRELKEETNLEGEPELVGIRHYRVFDKDSNAFLEDKCMFIFKVLDPKGELKSNEEGEFEWIKFAGIPKVVTNPLEEFNEVLEIVKDSGELTFKEVIHKTEKF